MEIITFRLAEHEWVPNNPRLPVIIYRQPLPSARAEDLIGEFERVFKAHGWPPQWRDGVYDYHHYHSTAHEALGVVAGQAVLTIGGPGGRDIELSAGDAILLPAGTGHRALKSSKDFLVVGAYPEGQSWDICREAPDPEARLRMTSMPYPEHDPVMGPGGPACVQRAAQLDD